MKNYIWSQSILFSLTLQSFFDFNRPFIALSYDMYMLYVKCRKFDRKSKFKIDVLKYSLFAL